MEENAFARWWTAGFKTLLPIVPPKAPISANSLLAKRISAGKDPRGKTPGRMNGGGLWSSFDWIRHEASEIDVGAWSTMGAGTGLRLGDGLYFLDADILDQKLAEAILRAFAARIPGNHAIRIGRAPKWGVLLRCDEQLRYRRIEFGDAGERVELLGKGKQVVVDGIHPATGKPYSWRPDRPQMAELVETDLSTIESLFADLAAILPQPRAQVVEGQGSEDTAQGMLRGDYDRVRIALEVMGNEHEHFPSRESFRDVGYAIKASIEDDAAAYGLFEAWASKWVGPDGEENAPEVVDAMWRTLRPPFRIGAEWIYAKAEECSRARGVEFSVAELFFAPETPEPEDIWDTQQAATKDKRKFVFETVGQLAERALAESAEPLVGELLDCGAMSVVYGESNAGKSAVVLDMAAHIAMGKPWGGLECKAGVVVYIAGEGGHGLLKRAAALKLTYPDLTDDRLVFLRTAIDLYSPQADIGPLCADLSGLAAVVGRVDLVVVDTFARIMGGGDENLVKDVSLVVSHTDRLRAVTGAHLLFVHHSGKDKSRGARGSSALRAATDTEIEIEPGSIRVTKQRDLEIKTDCAAFAIVSCAIGIDARGKEVTAARLRLLPHGERPAPDIGSLSAGERVVFDRLMALAATSVDGSGHVAQADLVFSLERSDVGLTGVRVLLQRIAEKGFIAPCEGGAGRRVIWQIKTNAATVKADAFFKEESNLTDHDVTSASETVVTSGDDPFE